MKKFLMLTLSIAGLVPVGLQAMDAALQARYIAKLNEALLSEIASAAQYQKDATKANAALALTLREAAQDELRHAQTDLNIITSLGGKPAIIDANGLLTTKIENATIPTQASTSEYDAIKGYGNLIVIAQKLGRTSEVEALLKILKDEKRHAELEQPAGMM